MTAVLNPRGPLMKKRVAKVKTPVVSEEDRNQDYAERLAELEAELRACA